MAPKPDTSPLLGTPMSADVSAGPPTRELGAVTQSQGGIGGWAAFLDEQEYVPELSFPSSIQSYHRMRSDSQVEALHSGTTQPIREFRWAIDPNKAPSKIVEAAAADLGLPLKGEEDDPIPRARNEFVFDDFLADALLAPLYGFFHFEIVGQVVEGKEWRMTKLSPRHPRLTAEFQQMRTGELLGIRQSIQGSEVGRTGLAGWSALPPPIPAWALIPFVWRSEAGSLVGRSMLRAIYREWLVKDRTLRVAAINLERGSGVPVIEGAPGASDEQIRDLAQLARQFKVAEGGGGAIPYGSKLTLVGGNVPEAINLLKYCDECMARVWALMLVQLGMTQTGNRALGAEFAIYAARAQRSWAKWVKGRVDTFLDRYTEWNDPLADYAPLLTFEQSKPDSMSVTDLVALIDAQAITVDPELEEWLRSENGLPEKPEPPDGGEELGPLEPDEVELVQQKRQAQDGKVVLPSPTLDPTSQSPTLASATTANPTGVERVFNGIRASLTLPDRELRRAPNAGEIQAAVDFAGLDGAHAAALNRLWQTFRSDVIPAQAQEIGDAIRALPILSRTAVSALQLAPSGEGILHEQLLAAARSGADTAAREMQAQGAAVEAPTASALMARVRDQAQAVAALNANGMSLAAQRKAASLISTGGRTQEQVAAEVESHLLGMKHAWTKEQLRGAVTMAQNQGRIGTFTQVEPEPTYQASEILDDRTCDPCAAIDGKVYANIEEAEADYAAGGFVDCEGGPNCRGTLVAVRDEQNPASEGGRVGEGATPPIRPSDEAELPGPGTPEIPGVETPTEAPADASAIGSASEAAAFLHDRVGLTHEEVVDASGQLKSVPIPIDFGVLSNDSEQSLGVLREASQAIADARARLGPEATKIDGVYGATRAGERLDKGVFAAVRWTPTDGLPRRGNTGEVELLLNDRQVAKLANTNLAASHTGQLSKATFDTYGRTLHEMGHVYLDNLPGGEAIAERILKAAHLGPAVREDGDLISRYTHQNTHEGFAEVFATLMRPGAVDYDYGAGDPAVDARVKGELRHFREAWNAELARVSPDYARLPPIEKGAPMPAPPPGITEGRRPPGRPPRTDLVRGLQGLVEVTNPGVDDEARVAAKVTDRAAKWSERAVIERVGGASQDPDAKEAVEPLAKANDLRGEISDERAAIERVEEEAEENESSDTWKAVLRALIPDLVVVLEGGGLVTPTDVTTVKRFSGTTFVARAAVAPGGALSHGNLAYELRKSYGHSIAALLGDEDQAILALMPEAEREAHGEGIAALFALVTDPKYRPEHWPPGVRRAEAALIERLTGREEEEGGYPPPPRGPRPLHPAGPSDLAKELGGLG